MKLRTLLATAGVTVVTTAALAPAASAQTGLNLDLGLGKVIIDNTPCQAVEAGLNSANLLEDGMTRNELASEIRGLTAGIDLGIVGFTLTSQYGGIVADKALDCGLVEEDPAGPFAASSEFLESLGLPGIPAELQNLSSF